MIFIMIVIIEGPDGAGKTTLAKQLMDKYNLSYHHEGPPPTDIHPLKYYSDVLENIAHKNNVVIDRFALGERVYGPPLRGEDRLGDYQWAEMNDHFRFWGVKQVLCLPPVDVCHKAWKQSKKSELFDDPKIFLETYARYGYFASRYEFIIYDRTKLWALEDLYVNLNNPRNSR